MSAPHRDLPPGSQRWAEQVDALMDEVASLRALVNRLATDARVDPSNPTAGITDANTPPSAQSSQQTRISQFADVNTYNVANGQVLTWSQADQAWVAKDLPVDDDTGGGGTGGSVGTFTPLPETPFSLYGTDPQGVGHNVDSSGHYAFTASSDRDAMMAVNDPSFGDANVYLGGAGVTLQSDAPQDGPDWTEYSKIVVAKDQVLIRSIPSNGPSNEGGIVSISCRWFCIPVNGNLYAATGQRGAMTLDPATNKPLWSDGTNWRDATGTIVY